MKSELTSRRVRRGLKRSRVLRRGCSYRAYEDDDLKWFWAAYRTGAFSGILEGGLSQEAFTENMLMTISALLEKGGEFIVTEAVVAGQGVSPVGIFVVEFADLSAWPGAHWFEWATKRNKLECSVLFLRNLKREVMPMIVAEPELVPFYSHIARYGLLRRAGTIPNYRVNEKGIIFHGVV